MTMELGGDCVCPTCGTGCTIFYDPFTATRAADGYNRLGSTRFTGTTGDWTQSGGRLTCNTTGATLTFTTTTAKAAAILENVQIPAVNGYIELSNGFATYRVTAIVNSNGFKDIQRTLSTYSEVLSYDAPGSPTGIGYNAFGSYPLLLPIVKLAVHRCDGTADEPDICTRLYHVGTDLITTRDDSAESITYPQNPVKGGINRIISGDYSAEPVTWTIKASSGVSFDSVGAYRTGKACLDPTLDDTELFVDDRPTSLTITLPTFVTPKQAQHAAGYAACETAAAATRDTDLAALDPASATYCDDVQTIWQAYYDAEAACPRECVEFENSLCGQFSEAEVQLDQLQPATMPLWLYTPDTAPYLGAATWWYGRMPIVDGDSSFVDFYAAMYRETYDEMIDPLERVHFKLFTPFNIGVESIIIQSPIYNMGDVSGLTAVDFTANPIGFGSPIELQSLTFQKKWHGLSGTSNNKLPTSPAGDWNRGINNDAPVACFGTSETFDPSPVGCEYDRPRTPAEVALCDTIRIEEEEAGCLGTKDGDYVSCYGAYAEGTPELIDCLATADATYDACIAAIPTHFLECDDPIHVTTELTFDAAADYVCDSAGTGPLEIDGQLGDPA